MDPLEHYRYLTLARARLLDGARALTPEQYTQEFPFGLRSVRRTLQHMAGAEWYLIGQLRGGPEGAYPFSSERAPDLAALAEAWRGLEPVTRRTLEAEADWDRPIEFITTIPGRRRFRVKGSPAAIFAQFCYHEVHHRAQVMAMLRQVGITVESMDFVLLNAEVTELTGEA